MGLFDKKFCSVCGGKIGMMGNRKLEDGNLCKACAAQLSPWFSDRRSSTVDEIKAQLADREENKTAVSELHVTRVIGGDSTKLHIDEDAGKFVVTASRNLVDANPDVLELGQVTGCELDVQEHQNEIYRKDKDGHNVSYNPKRYEYSYDFYIEIYVNHPYFDQMRFKLNSSSVKTGQRSINDAPPATANTRPTVRGNAAYVQNTTEAVIGGLLNALSGQPTAAVTEANLTWNQEYNSYTAMGNEIRELLMNARQQVRDEARAAAQPKQAVTCPWCGATSIPDANGCCEYCGGSLTG